MAFALCGATLLAPLLFPKPGTSADTQVAFTRADAVRQLDPARPDAERPHLLLEDFVTTATTLRAHTAAVVHHTATTKPKRATTRTTVKPKARSSKPDAKAKAASTKSAPSAPVNPGPPSVTGHSETGQASWYDAPSGTCAHRTIPKGLVVTVTNVANGKSVTCKVSDRGPYVNGRIIDLSRSAFQALAPSRSGVIDVRVDW